MNNIFPICCFLGHVDAGKTSLLDYLRNSNIHTNEAGGITQQIGATVFSENAIKSLSGSLNQSLEISGLLIIDTPGHDCFTQMRLIGIKVSHLPIIVVDIIKGLEKQTIQCIELLIKYDKQFIIALNKLDRIYGWKTTKNKNLKDVFANQNKNTLSLMKTYSDKIMYQVSELGLNACLYYENSDPKNNISMVPVSAKTGEGISDLIVLVSKLTYKKMDKQIKNTNAYKYAFGYIIETRLDEHNGLVNYALLLSKKIKKGDELLIESCKGQTIRATVKELYLPPDQKEMKNKVNFKSVEEINGTTGFAIKFTEQNINDRIADGAIFIIACESDSETIINNQICQYDTEYEIKYDKVGIIINVSSRGMARAVMKLLSDDNIHVQDINVGKISKTCLIQVSSHLQQFKNKVDYIYNKRYAVILNYNNLYKCDDELEYSKEIYDLCIKLDVKIISGNTIYKLIEKYKQYINDLDTSIIEMYPNIKSEFKLEILPKYIFLNKSPLLFGVRVISGEIKCGISVKAYLGTEYLNLGILTNIEKNNKSVDKAIKDEEVCIRIESNDNSKQYKYGRHFDYKWTLEPFLSNDDENIKLKYPSLLNKMIKKIDS